MVLHDMSDPTPDSFTEPPNPSDADPYASPPSSATASRSRFDAADLASPVPVVGPLIGFSSRAVRFRVDTTLSFAEKKLGRTLHPEEAHALAFHMYKLEKSKSYYAAAGAAGGAYRWYATMATYQYPFYKPPLASIDANKFGPFKGPNANLARHSWRFTLYAAVASQMGKIIGQVISQPIAAMETSQDPRLEEFARDLKAANAQDERANSERGRMMEERRKEFEARRRQEGTGGMTPPYGRTQTQTRTRADRGAADDDDMSPTAGNEPWGTTSASSSWGDFASEEQPKPQPDRASTDPRARRQPAYQSTQPPATPPSPFDADDDASPTAGLFHSETTAPPPQPLRPGESSWDRLRRGAGASAQADGAPQSRTQRFGSSRPGRGGEGGDSFSYGEARDVDQGQARREFEERMQRERSGGDFNQAGSGKW